LLHVYLNIAPHWLWLVPGLSNSSSSSLKRIYFQNILDCSATEEIEYNI